MEDSPTPRPNFVLILVDDMGFSDIGCYGSEIRTPNLDRLAHGGMRFSQMYNYARCCPTRACMLTGAYPHQAGIGHMMENTGSPSYQGYLRDDVVTIAEALKSGGYRTYMSGKWHVGGAYDPTRPESWRPGEDGHPTPRQRGFDRYYGTLDGAGSFFAPYSLMEDDSFVNRGAESGSQGKGQIDQTSAAGAYYYTDAISDRAVKMIEESLLTEDPFFLYVSYTAPHWPLHALPQDIAKYEGTYRNGGWDALRTARHEELKGMGLLDSRWQISPRDESAPPWEDSRNQDWEDMRMAVYAAQIDRMDQGVGRILAALEASQLDENTLILFLSDNGGCAEFLSENGWVDRYSDWTPDGRPMRVGNDPNLLPGGPHTFMSYDLPWANASNAPFRLYKHWVHEGGISTPLVAHWPSTIQPNQIVHEACHVIDVLPTLLDAAGIAQPDEYNGQPVLPMEGESFLPLLRGAQWSRQGHIFWEHEGNRAVRLGRWKLVSKHGGRWELYDMLEDRTELNDLSEKNRPKVEEFADLYHAWAERVGVLPWPLRR
ncbi:MAG: arylsulfatase [Caldilineaceae bacterium SB0661_bin_32]|uniref:Arylsulfatase n=1 Tax=Caldilineaceae bacterium SB0661_bin_32 TaxID=2605255 RepID=A0A6B1DBM0_9CHLR|nr:arylsulfatase [Caldilineaceae bacterium SB0661_bin_32]